ncbi:MAG TPA: hypothetical protein VHA56_17975 [Mucilaginibacter sp.]|nr:hypothetical protein [Mucilaginibacter sp.]
MKTLPGRSLFYNVLLLVSFFATVSQTSAQTYPVTAINISLPAFPYANTALWGNGASMAVITATARISGAHVDPLLTRTSMPILFSVAKRSAGIKRQRLKIQRFRFNDRGSVVEYAAA